MSHNLNNEKEDASATPTPKDYLMSSRSGFSNILVFWALLFCSKYSVCKFKTSRFSLKSSRKLPNCMENL